MVDLGMVRVASVVPRIKIGNPDYNADEIIRLLEEAEANGVGIALFPELTITGYTCADLFYQKKLYDAQLDAFAKILDATQDFLTAFILGIYVRIGARYYNCAAFCQAGQVKAIVPKKCRPSTKEFYESRWFASGTELSGKEIKIRLTASDGFDLGENIPVGDILIDLEGLIIGIEVCEDLWAPVTPGSLLALSGAEIIFNPSASNEIVSKKEYRESLVANASATQISGYVYASCGVGESTTDIVFSGDALIAENGSVI
ncbi:MAG: NAD(+) synthase, partial [Clostridiales Family XIII bacterium]|nr:NAD(+) synthase [Clostridiales Family XIII bacterium]